MMDPVLARHNQERERRGLIHPDTRRQLDAEDQCNADVGVMAKKLVQEIRRLRFADDDARQGFAAVLDCLISVVKLRCATYPETTIPYAVPAFGHMLAMLPDDYAPTDMISWCVANIPGFKRRPRTLAPPVEPEAEADDQAPPPAAVEP